MVAASTSLQSPYALDYDPGPSFDGWATLSEPRIYFDGVFKGDYSLAIVNRQLARSLIDAGLDLSCYSPEQDWQTDATLLGMPDVMGRMISEPPAPGLFDIHLRNTWPPKAGDMIGKLNAYVCFAWEEIQAPRDMIEHFNLNLDLMMVTANFVAEAFIASGLKTPIAVVGNGVDHFLKGAEALPPKSRSSGTKQILHVSSCFPRKGVDLLIRAFLEEFRPEDDVKLTIKTFANIHNDVEKTVETAQQAQEDPAPIEIIKSSLPEVQLRALIRDSDVLAAPSRGEGFGLPLAEASLLGIPVVTTDYSGQTDFCLPETSWLIDYNLVPSSAHVADEHAVWADPDIGSLRRALRAALDHPKEADKRILAGQDLLLAHFKWSDVARRVGQALAPVSRDLGQAVPKEFSKGGVIDLVSTWDQSCGIATYSAHLFDTPALGNELRRVLSREIKGDGVDSLSSIDVPVDRVWGYDYYGILALGETIRAQSSGVLWMQHHPGFFSDHDMSTIAEALGASGYELSCITLHNVAETLNKAADWLESFDLILVHTDDDAVLLAKRTSTTVVVVPHGIKKASGASQAAECDHFTIGTFGFLYPHKNIPLLIEAFGQAALIDPRLRLRILTCVKRDPISWKERAKVEQCISLLGLEDRVETEFGFLSDAEVAKGLGSCDLICFPYGDSSESATGAARIALSADVPLLCSQSNVLKDIRPYSLCLPETSPEIIAEAMLMLSARPEIAGLRNFERRAYIAATSYDQVAQRYKNILSKKMRLQTNVC